MEPNVDRGMWSVVALLAAIVIGGVILLAFPKISGKITNSMDDTVNKAFDGETPEWAQAPENLATKTYHHSPLNHGHLVLPIKENEADELYLEYGVRYLDGEKPYQASTVIGYDHRVSSEYFVYGELIERRTVGNTVYFKQKVKRTPEMRPFYQ